MDTHQLDSSAVKLLESVVSEFSDRCRRGEDPSVDEYIGRHPQLGGQLREVLPALRMLGRLTPGGSSRRRAPVGVAVPETIGDYRIVREIGRGGMGVVYHAVQQSLERPVALKVLPHNAVDPTSHERFRREASIAAQLHHTNIVPVFGTGSSGELHYYAMQYIDGESLDRVIARLRELEPQLDATFRFTGAPPPERDRFDAAARRLLEGRLGTPAPESTDDGNGAGRKAPAALEVSTKGSSSTVARLRTGYFGCVAQIGIQAARALAHSHAHGVLHRDIKPSNLILDRSGTLWVTDFGLARQDDQAGLTSAGDLVGTLRYLAPERFRGVVDARADIYALGLTLYELLTFHSPFDESDRQRLLKRIVESEPPPPRKLRPGIPRDLETIVAKAIAKEPGHRYASAAELADDLQRWLEGRPVSARPIGSLGRAWRWCRRNPIVASLASSLLVVLAVGLAVVTWQWWRAETGLELAVQAQREAADNLAEANRQRDRAEANFRQARQAVDDYLTTISENKLLDVPTLEPVRAELLARAKDYYEMFLSRRGDDPQVKAELAATNIRLGQILHDLDGDWRPYFEQGLGILEELVASGVQLGDSRSWREGVYVSRAGWLHSDDPEQLLPLVERSITIWTQLVDQHPDVQGFRSDLAAMHQLRGMIHLAGRRFERALAEFETSLALREALADEHPDAEKVQHGLAESYTMIGIVKLQDGALDEAQRSLTRSKELFDALTRSDPSATRLADLQAAVHQWLAAVRLRQGRPLEALAEFRQAISLQQRLAREYPYVPRFQTNLSNSYTMLGRSLFNAGQDKMAEATFQECFEHLERLETDYPENAEYRRAHAQALCDLGGWLNQRDRLDEAETLSQRALQLLEADDASHGTALALVHFRLGRVREDRDEPGEAETHYRQAVELERAAESSSTLQLAWYLFYQGKMLEQLEKPAEAAEAYRAAIDERVNNQAGLDGDLADLRLRVARIDEAADRLDEAEAQYRLVVDELRGGDNEKATEAAQRLADLLRRQGREQEAEDVLGEAGRSENDAAE